jgi:hypothetical protein
MKTYTLEELEAAQAKGCRIEYCENEVWQKVLKHLPFSSLVVHAQHLRIHPADEWKARLPRLKEGAKWHRKDFTNEMLEGGYRPLLEGEACEHGDEVHLPLQDRWSDSGLDFGARMTSRHLHTRTRRPVPPEFLHPDELAKQPEAAQAPDFGEPWETVVSGSINTSGDFDGMIEILSNKRVVARFYEPDDKNEADFSRIIACVNALAGVPDPAEFVRQAKEMRTTLEEMANMPEYDQDDAHRLRHKAKETLSKLKPFLP